MPRRPVNPEPVDWDALPELLDRPLVAKVLNRSEGWVYQRWQANELPHRKLGGAILTPKAMLRQWLGYQDPAAETPAVTLRVA